MQNLERDGTYNTNTEQFAENISVVVDKNEKLCNLIEQQLLCENTQFLNKMKNHHSICDVAAVYPRNDSTAEGHVDMVSKGDSLIIKNAP